MVAALGIGETVKLGDLRPLYDVAIELMRLADPDENSDASDSDSSSRLSSEAADELVDHIAVWSLDVLAHEWIRAFGRVQLRWAPQIPETAPRLELTPELVPTFFRRMLPEVVRAHPEWFESAGTLRNALSIVEPAAELLVQWSRLRRSLGDLLGGAILMDRTSESLAAHVHSGSLGLEQAQAAHRNSWNEALIGKVVEGSIDGELALEVGDWTAALVSAFCAGEYDLSTCRAIDRGSPKAGMNQRAVRLMWGRPDHVREKALKTKTRVEWTWYRKEPGPKRVWRRAKFVDGLLNEWELA